MNNDFTCRGIYRIPDMEFVRGDHILIPFKFLDKDDNVIIPSNNLRIRWVLSKYQYPDIVELSYSTDDYIQVADDGTIFVEINSADSFSLSDDKYIQQPLLEYTGGGANELFIRAIGCITFIGRVGGLV